MNIESNDDRKFNVAQNYDSEVLSRKKSDLFESLLLKKSRPENKFQPQFFLIGNAIRHQFNRCRCKDFDISQSVATLLPCGQRFDYSAGKKFVRSIAKYGSENIRSAVIFRVR